MRSEGSAKVTGAFAAHWERRFGEVMERIGLRFNRVEPRRRASVSLRGLLASLQRNNSWQPAEAAGDPRPTGMQQFLNRVKWDAEAVCDDLRTSVSEHLRAPQAVLALDETNLLTKGTRSAGMQVQDTGMLGVFLAYASRHGHALRLARITST